MKRFDLRCLICLALLVAACGEDEHSTAAQASAEQTSAVTREETRGETTAATTPTEPQAAEQQAAEQQTTPNEPQRTLPRQRRQGAPARSDIRRAQEIARLRREGRRLGRAGDHLEAQLRFESALELAPSDPTLLCEAGYQALQSEMADEALPYFLRGLRTAPPRTRGACLYNAGLALHQMGRLAAAIDYLEQSIAVRPNRTASRRLERIRAEQRELESEEEAFDEGDYFDDELDIEPMLEAAPRASVNEFCLRFDCTFDSRECVELGPRGTPTFRAACPVSFTEGNNMPSYLIVRGDAGWKLLEERIADCDIRDIFGAVEICETVSLALNGGTLRVLVSGGQDEHEDESSVYFECESEHQDDDDAANDCYMEWRDAQGALPEWENEYARYEQPDEFPDVFDR